MWDLPDDCHHLMQHGLNITVWSGQAEVASASKRRAGAASGGKQRSILDFFGALPAGRAGAGQPAAQGGAVMCMVLWFPLCMQRSELTCMVPWRH